MPRKLSDIAIAVRVVPTMLRWPSSDAASTIVWDRLRDAVEALRSLVRSVDDDCDKVEHDSHLNWEGIARRRIELGNQALSKLAAFTPLHSSELTVDKNINDFEPKMQNLLRKAIDELREGVAAAERAVVERCRMRAVPQQDVRFRG